MLKPEMKTWGGSSSLASDSASAKTNPTQPNEPTAAFSLTSEKAVPHCHPERSEGSRALPARVHKRMYPKRRTRVAARKTLAMFVSVVLVVGLMPSLSAWGDPNDETKFVQERSEIDEDEEPVESGNGNLDESSETEGVVSLVGKAVDIESVDEAQKDVAIGIDAEASLLEGAYGEEDQQSEVHIMASDDDETPNELWVNVPWTGKATLSSALTNYYIYSGESITVDLIYGNSATTYGVKIREWKKNNNGYADRVVFQSTSMESGKRYSFTISFNGSAKRMVTYNGTGGNYVTLNLRYESLSKKFDLVLDPNDGSSAKKTTYTEGTNASLGSANRSGFTFAGWNSERNGSGKHYAKAANILIRGSMTLYAEWTRTAEMVTGPVGTASVDSVSYYYDADGIDYVNGETGKSVDVSIDANERAGWTVLGWTKNPKSTVADFDPSLTISGSDLAVAKDKYYAIGERDLRITYDGNGATSGAVPAPQGDGKQVYNASGQAQTSRGADTFNIAGAGDLARSDRVFAGWNTEPDGSGTAYAAGQRVKISEPVTLYAQWAYPVTYDANGGNDDTAPLPQQKLLGKNLTLHAGQPSRDPDTADIQTVLKYNDGSTGDETKTTKRSEAWSFKGWTTEDTVGSRKGVVTSDKWDNVDGSKKYVPGGIYDKDEALTLYAQWEVQNPTYGSTALPTPEWDGYDFLGWATIPNIVEKTEGEDYALYKGGDTYTPTSDGTLYAQWKRKTYEVTYHANADSGVTGVPDSPAVKTHGVDLDVAPDASRAEARENVTLTLNYKGGVYTGGDEGNELGANHDSATVEMVTTYDFGGWNTRADGHGKTYKAPGAYSENAPADLYAIWTPRPPTARSFALPSASRTPAGGSGVTSYTFVGWSTDPTATKDKGTVLGKGDSGYTPVTYELTEDTTLYAVWDPPTYAIEYDGNAGGDTVEGDLSLQTKELNVDIKLHGKPTRTVASSSFAVSYDANFSGGSVEVNDGNTTAHNTVVYDFVGWADEADIGTAGVVTDEQWEAYAAGKKYEASATYTENKDVRLYAQWKVLSGAVGSVTLPAAPDRSGYKFLGWYDARVDGNLIGKAGDTYKPDGAVTLYAQWEAEKYTISYDANAGDAAVENMPDAQTKTADIDLQLSDKVPTRGDVSKFVKITYDAAGGGDCAEGASEYKSVYEFLSWKKGDALYAPESAYRENEGATLMAQWSETTTFDAVQLPETTREGYTFLGWFTESGDEAGEAGDEYTPVSKDAVTLRAHWEVVKYDVTYDGNADEEVTGVPETQRKVHGNALTLTGTTPTRAATVDSRFNVTFDPRNGDATTSVESSFDTEHLFQGWATVDTIMPGGTKGAVTAEEWAAYTSENKTYQPGGQYEENAPVTLYAQWKDVDTGAEVALPAAPTPPDRCEFKGWSLSKSTSPSAEANESVDDETKDLLIPGTKVHPTGAVTYYAIYDPPTYIVTYDANGGVDAPADQVKKQGKELTLSNEDGKPSRAGGDGSYEITYDPDGGSVERGSDVVATSTSYNFRGWAEDAAVGADAVAGLPTDAEWAAYAEAKKHGAGDTYKADTDLDLYAQWEEIITSDPAMVTLPAADRPGYEFLGWYDGDEPVGIAEKAYTPNGQDTTLTARWKAYEYPEEGATFTYTVVFEYEDGTKIGTQQFAFGEPQALDAGVLTAPEGKVFAGWKIKDGATAFTEHQLVSNLTDEANGTVTLVAQWKGAPTDGQDQPIDPSQYVTYKVQYWEQGTDGVMYQKESEDVIVEDADEYVEVPASALDAPLGFHVDWDDTVRSGTVAGDSSTTLAVYWARNQFDVEFLPGAADAAGTMAKQHFVWASGDALTANAFTRAGHTFTGWKVTERDGNELAAQSGGLSVQSLQSLVLSAQAIGDSVADEANGSRLTSTDSGHVTLTAQWKESSGGDGSDDTNGGGGGDDSDDPDNPNNPDKPKDPKDELADKIKEAEDLIDPDRDPDQDIDPDKPGLTDDERKLIDEIDEAKKVHDDPDATDGQVRDAIDRLTDAIAAFKAARDGDGSGGGASKADRTRGASGGTPFTGDATMTLVLGLGAMAFIAAAALALSRLQSRRSARVVGAWSAPARQAAAKSPTPRRVERGKHVRR